MQKAPDQPIKLVTDMLSQFLEPAKTQKLMKKISDLYLLRSFKIKDIDTKHILDGYLRLQQKYEKEQINPMPEDWHKNQRKIFIWFLICYCEIFSLEIPAISQPEWEMFSTSFFGKSPKFLKFQGLNLTKNNKRCAWTEYQDQLLKKLIGNIGLNSWNQISKAIFFEGTNSPFISPKQCRQRWFNHLNKKINKSPWKPEEDLEILNLCQKDGKKWASIASQLKTNRTEHMVKNRYNSIMNSMNKDKKSKEEKQLLHIAIQHYKQKNNQLPKQEQMPEEKLEVGKDQKCGVLTELKIEQGDQEVQKKKQEFQKSTISLSADGLFSQNGNFTEMLTRMANNHGNGGFVTFNQNQVNSSFTLFNNGDFEHSIPLALTPMYQDLSPMDPSFLARSNTSLFFKNRSDRALSTNSFTTPTPTNPFTKSFNENSHLFFLKSGFSNKDDLTPKEYEKNQ